MADNWKPDGAARKAVMADGGQAALTALFKGLGRLSYGEMAGERMKLGLLLHDPEEEHDCFSDNTHNSLYYDAHRHQEPLSRLLQAHRWNGGLGAQRLRSRARQVAGDR